MHRHQHQLTIMLLRMHLRPAALAMNADLVALLHGHASDFHLVHGMLGLVFQFKMLWNSMKLKMLPFLCYIIAFNMSAMERDPLAPNNDPLRKDKASFISWLPQELYNEFLLFHNNENQQLALNFFLLKHKEKQGFLSNLEYPRDTKIVSVDENNKRLLLQNVNNGRCFLWNIETQKVDHDFAALFDLPEAWIPCFDYKNQLYFSLDDNSVYSWNLVTNERRYICSRPQGKLEKVIISPTRKVVIFNFFNNPLHIHSITTGETKLWRNSAGIEDKVETIAFDESSNYLFVALRNKIEVWNLKKNLHITSLPIGTFNFLSVKNNKLSGINGDGTIHQWDIKENFKHIAVTATAESIPTCPTNFLVDFKNNLLFIRTKKIKIVDIKNNIQIGTLGINFSRSLDFFDNIHNCLYTNSGITNTMQVSQLHDSQMKTDIYNPMSIHKAVLFEKAYEVWRANEKINEIIKNNFWFFGSVTKEKLDLTKSKILHEVFCKLLPAMQQVMREQIPIIEPEPKIQEQKEATFMLRRF